MIIFIEDNDRLITINWTQVSHAVPHSDNPDGFTVYFVNEMEWSFDKGYKRLQEALKVVHEWSEL